MQIKALGYIGIESTNPAEWKSFLENIAGMMPAPAMQQTDDELYFKMDEYSYRFRIFKGEKNRLAIAGWELEDKKDFDQALAELDAAGVSYTRMTQQEADKRLVREGVFLKDPGGNDLELFYYQKLDYKRLVSPVGIPEFETGYHGNMGLGHFVIPTAQFEECHKFYSEVLGFGQTDYMQFNFVPEVTQGLHFMHVNNPRHHSLAIFQDPNPPESNCVHLMIEVKNIDEVGYFIDRCKENEVPIVSGLGRHTNDLMMSVYVATPGGFALEFGCDGVQLDWDNYQPTESSEPSLWGHDWQV